MFKTWVWKIYIGILSLFIINGAYAVTCQSNEFEYDGQCIESKFEITTTNDTDRFVFTMSAKGTFYIDWGDGNVEMINRTGTTMTEYTHNYAGTNEYIIKFGGLATGYANSYTGGEAAQGTAIYFGKGTTDYTTNNTYLNLAGISGSLGAIFPTIGNGGIYAKQPRFKRTFYGTTNLVSSIPSDLFNGISGSAGYINDMFYCTFANSGVTGQIPEDLFGREINGVYYGINGRVGQRYFNNLFSGCTGLTGSIPEKLFGRIINGVYHGAIITAYQVFFRTFSRCSGLTGTDIDDPNNPGQKYAIPPNLFFGAQGKMLGNGIFSYTFYGCSGLTGTIPPGLFGNIHGKPTDSIFSNTFYGCTGLTGPIPSNLFSGIVGKPAQYMFYNTFANCTNLGKDSIGGTSTYYIPPELFAGIDKTSIATYMMASVFYATGLLTTCPSGTTEYITGFESYFNGKKSCTSCPVTYPDYNTDTQQCYAQVSYIDSDNDTLLKTEDVYYDAQNASGYNLPSYSPTKPDTILSDWTTGNGTVIDTNDTLTGNQVVYSKWRFNCDSDKWMYFNIENNETTRMCLCNDKRTEHTLVINHGGDTYHAMLVPESEHDYTINSNTQRHLKVQMGNTIYNAYDASVLFGN